MTKDSAKPQRDECLRESLVEEVPSLRAFSRSLCRDASTADDLVQETLVKALASLDSFAPGTNLKAWLFTILRNTFYSDYRKRKRETITPAEVIEDQLVSKPAQDGHMDLQDFRTAMYDLPDDQREALMLVGAAGMAYEEAADICGCAVGTIKSRVSRARDRLTDILGIDSLDELGADATSEAVVATAGEGVSTQVELAKAAE